MTLKHVNEVRERSTGKSIKGESIHSRESNCQFVRFVITIN